MYNIPRPRRRAEKAIAREQQILNCENTGLAYQRASRICWSAKVNCCIFEGIRQSIAVLDSYRGSHRVYNIPGPRRRAEKAIAREQVLNCVNTGLVYQRASRIRWNAERLTALLEGRAKHRHT